MSDVYLVTSADFPDGEPGGELLVDALAGCDLEARWVVWDDAEVDWSTPRLVAVRSTWDYHARVADFLAWADHVEQWSTLVNGAAAFRWNLDKAYLVDLGATGLPVVPTTLLDRADQLFAAAAEHPGRVLVKPRVGAGGRGVVVLEADPAPADVLGLGVELTGPIPVLAGGPWVVQPLVESVTSEGEHSVFVLDGLPVAQVRKVPALGEVRVHEQYGGSTVATELSFEAATLAVDAVAAAEDVLALEGVATELAYARVDLLRLADGRLAVSELEIIEPGLYLDIVPRNARKFAQAVLEVAARLG